MWYEPKEKTLHSGSAATGNGQIFDLEGKYGALRLQVTGITSATITFEQCNDGGTTWDGIAGINTETGAKVTTTTADGTFLFPIPGVKKFRARISTYVTGTINVYAVAVPADVASMEVILSSSDIEIGAVELKNATTDDRAVITAGGEVYTDTRKIAGVTPQFDDTDKFAVSVYGKSVAAGDTPMLVDATGHVQVDVVGALPAGSAIIGKTGIDQTTPGTTNGVQVNAALPAGTAIIGKVGIDQTTDGTTNKVHAHSSAADDFLANANIQVGDADVAVGNPVPVAGTAAHDAAASGNPVQVAGVYRSSDPTLSDGDVGSLRINSKGEMRVEAVVSLASISASQTRPDNTTAYTAGDVVGQDSAANITFSNVSTVAGGGFIILGARLRIDVSAIPSGMSGFRLHLYSSAPTAITDNLAYNLPSADRGKYLGCIALVSQRDAGDTLWIQEDNVNFANKLAGASTTLYGILETIGGYTPTALVVKTITLIISEA